LRAVRGVNRSRISQLRSSFRQSGRPRWDASSASREWPCSRHHRIVSRTMRAPRPDGARQVRCTLRPGRAASQKGRTAAVGFVGARYSRPRGRPRAGDGRGGDLRCYRPWLWL